MIANRIITAFVIFAILAAGSAAAAQEPVDEADLWQSLASKLQPGTSVEVRLKDRSRIRGFVIDKTAESFVIKPAKRIEVPAVSVSFTNVQSIHPWREGLPPGVKVLIGVGIGVGAVMLAGWAALAAAGY